MITQSSAQPFAHITPEFVPLPLRGRDPYFGLGRTSWYELEKDGVLQLVRIRRPGMIRGKVLIPFAQAAEALRKLSAAQAAPKKAAASTS